MASPEVQLASQRIRRVQFSVNAIPVRLHSACLTGNVFGSRRCDCGDQLRLALALLEDLGGGIILYLAQEARRLGLANKMRTISRRTTASTRLTPTPHSASMTMSATTASPHACSGCFTTRGSVLTNNPAKLNGLTKAALKLPAGCRSRRRSMPTAAVIGHLTFGLRSSCERAELMLALVTRVTPVSTLADTFSPFEAASAVLTPS